MFPAGHGADATNSNRQSCRLITESDEPLDDLNETADAPPTTLTITSEGLDIVQRPTRDEIKGLVNGTEAKQSLLALGEDTGPSSGSSLLSTSSGGSTAPSDTAASETPGSTLASDDTTGTNDTLISETDALRPFGVDYDDGGKVPIKMPRPVISVQTFTPLIGSLLMSQSAVVCESAKAAIVGILARLRGKELPTYDPWPQRHVAVGEQKTYLAQTGIHVHEITTLTEHEKKVVENELVQAIVIGMARLDETQSPYNLNEEDEVYDLEGQDQPYEGTWDPDSPLGEEDQPTDGLQEADDLQDHLHRSEPSLLATPYSDETILYDARRPNPFDLHPLAVDESPSIDEAHFRQKAHPTMDLSSNPEIPVQEEPENFQSQPSSSYVDASVAEHALLNSDEFDSPNAPPVDNRTDPDEAEWAASGGDDLLELGDDTFKDELAFEASHGRLLSMNLISAVTECKVLEGDDIIAKQFVPEVVRMRFDESFGVRREAALAMGELLKVVPQEVVNQELVSIVTVRTPSTGFYADCRVWWHL